MSCGELPARASAAEEDGRQRLIDVAQPALTVGVETRRRDAAELDTAVATITAPLSIGTREINIRA